MSILIYKKENIYDPNTESNKLRRNMKREIRMKYVKKPISIPVLNIMLKIPGIRYLYKLTLLGGIKIMKLIANDEQKEFLDLKFDITSDKDTKTNKLLTIK